MADNKVHDDKINETLKFSAVKFKEECTDICKNLLESKFKQMSEEVIQKFDSEIKNNIMTSIGCKDLYDYSTIQLKYCPYHEFYYDKCSDLIDPVEPYYKEEHLRKCRIPTDRDMEIVLWRDVKEHYDILNQFLKMSKGEKIVIRYTKYEKYHKWYARLISVTNYGKVMYYDWNDDTDDIRMCDFNFQVPIDYIKIIQRCSPYDIVEILNIMKEMLYNRKFAPLYVKDIIEENNKLRSKCELEENDMKKYYEDKKRFETLMDLTKVFKFEQNNINIKMEDESDKIVVDKYSKTDEVKNNDEIKNLEHFLKSDKLMYQDLFERKNQSINITNLYYYLNNAFKAYGHDNNKTYNSIKEGYIGNDNNDLNKRPEWTHALLHIYHNVIKTIIVNIEKNSCAETKKGTVIFKKVNINFTDKIVNSHVFKECINLAHEIIIYITKFISIKIDTDQVIKYYKIVFHKYDNNGPFIEWYIIEGDEPEDEKKLQEETFVIITQNISEKITSWLDIVDKKISDKKIVASNTDKIMLGEDIELLNEKEEFDKEVMKYYEKIKEFCEKKMIGQINKKINFWNVEIKKLLPLKIPHLEIPIVDTHNYFHFEGNRLELLIIIKTN